MGNVLGKRIKSLRQNSGYTQIALSEKLNVSNTTLSQYESGVRIPSDDIKLKIADIFDVSVDYLLGKVDIRNSNDSNPPVKEDKLASYLKQMTPEQQKRVLEYAEFLKSRSEFAEDVSTALDTLSQKPLTES